MSANNNDNDNDKGLIKLDYAGPMYYVPNKVMKKSVSVSTVKKLPVCGHCGNFPNSNSCKCPYTYSIFTFRTYYPLGVCNRSNCLNQICTYNGYGNCFYHLCPVCKKEKSSVNSTCGSRYCQQNC